MAICKCDIHDGVIVVWETDNIIKECPLCFEINNVYELQGKLKAANRRVSCEDAMARMTVRNKGKQPQHKICPVCDGDGHLMSDGKPYECPLCEGPGKLRTIC